MADAKTRSFAWVIRERRRQLDLTQEDVARRIKTSVPYIGLLEAAKRHPSEKVVAKLATVLGFEPRGVLPGQSKSKGPNFRAARFQQSVCLGCFHQRREAARDSQHNRPRDGSPLKNCGDGRSKKSARLRFHPERNPPGFRSIVLPGRALILPASDLWNLNGRAGPSALD